MQISKYIEARTIIGKADASDANRESVRESYKKMRAAVEMSIGIWEDHLHRAQTKDVGVTSHYVSIFGVSILSSRSGTVTTAYQEYCNKQLSCLKKEKERYDKLIREDNCSLGSQDRGRYEAIIRENDKVLGELGAVRDKKYEIYIDLLSEYTRLKCSCGKLSLENQASLTSLLPQLAAGIGWVSATLGTIGGYFVKMRDIDLEDDIFCLKASNYMSPLLECSAISHVRTTQSLAYLQSESFQRSKNSMMYLYQRDKDKAVASGRMLELEEATVSLKVLAGKERTKVVTISKPRVDTRVEPDVF